jgi:hypothetical protein
MHWICRDLEVWKAFYSVSESVLEMTVFEGSSGDCMRIFSSFRCTDCGFEGISTRVTVY